MKNWLYYHWLVLRYGRKNQAIWHMRFLHRKCDMPLNRFDFKQINHTAKIGKKVF